MNEEAAFIRAICDQPDEDTPRLALADWLDEQGDEPNAVWAAFIRGSCWAARGLIDHLTERETWAMKYWHYYYQPWLKMLGLPPRGREVNQSSWSRGFPDSAEASFESFRHLRLQVRAPIQSLTLEGTTDATVEELTTWPELARLRSLGLKSNPLSDTAFVVLAGCPFLANLTSLRLPSAVVTDYGMTALLDSPNLQGLQSLRFDSTSAVQLLSTAVRDRVRARFGGETLGEWKPSRYVRY
jgi:uncharacterized protein (TIGR02996 family)